MGRAPCCEKVGLKRGKWTADEDEKLIKYIASTGVASWRSLPKMAGLLRCGKSCRLRWMNYLRADLKRGNITKEEDKIILNLHETLGNRWSVIAGHLPGRTDNEIKNHWNTHLKKRAQSFRKSDKDNKETTMPNKVPSDDSRSDRLTAKKLSNNASIRKVKNSKGDDLSTLPVQSEESNMTTNPHQFSCIATSSGERLQCSNHTFPIIRDEEISLLDFQRCTTNAESQVAPSFSGPTTSHSEHGIISSTSNGPGQELLQSETLSDLCQELLSPISLEVDSMASRVMCFGGETEGGALQLNESGIVDPQVWAMVDQEEVWDWDLEEIEDKLWGEEGEMWSWIREE